MDDIQFWIYIIFAIIYVVARALKKKPKPEENEGPVLQAPPRRTVTFEELLREFSENAKKTQEPEEAEVVEAEKPIRRLSEEIRAVEKRAPKKEAFEEGRTVMFADAESRRVYEESIRMAEGASIAFEPDEKYKARFGGLKKRDEGAVENPIAADVLAMLQDTDGAKRAVIMAEVLNRKY